MTEYEVLLSPRAAADLEDANDHARRSIRHTVKEIGDDPLPSREHSPKDQLPFGAENWYYYDLGRAWRIFYVIREEEAEVLVVGFERLQTAADTYGF